MTELKYEKKYSVLIKSVTKDTLYNTYNGHRNLSLKRVENRLEKCVLCINMLLP